MASGYIAGRRVFFVSPTRLSRATAPESLLLDRVLPLVSLTISFRATPRTAPLIWDLLQIESKIVTEVTPRLGLTRCQKNVDVQASKGPSEKPAPCSLHPTVFFPRVFTFR